MIFPVLCLYVNFFVLELANPYRTYCYADEMVLVQEEIYTYPNSRPGCRYHKFEIAFRHYWGDSDFSPYFDFLIATPRKVVIDQATCYRGRNYWEDVSLVVVPEKWDKDYMIWKIKVRDPENKLDINSPIHIQLWSSEIIPKTKHELDEEGRVIRTREEAEQGEGA
jgi:hypothetical protein